jgi:hypothetical protein
MRNKMKMRMNLEFIEIHSPTPTHSHSVMRRVRDSNSRYPFEIYTLSPDSYRRDAPSLLFF